MLLKKRLLSSPAAFANTLAQHRKTLDSYDTKQAPPTDAQLQAAWDRSDDGAADDESGEVVAQVLATASRGGAWSDERFIVFTEYRDTQKWLVDLLLAKGFGGDGGERSPPSTGGWTPDRERTKAEFQAHPSRSPVRILVATDAASEGIDLQRHCWRMLHWEIPWNPSRHPTILLHRPSSYRTRRQP